MFKIVRKICVQVSEKVGKLGNFFQIFGGNPVTFFKKKFYFIMWDYVHTESMRQRGTLRFLNKLALPQSSARIAPLEWLLNI